MTKIWKHCGKWRNCTFCAISSFVTMFSKSRLLQRRQKASIWGKGLTSFTTVCQSYHSSHVTWLSHIQQFCSRRLWKLLEKNMENLWKWKYNHYISSWKHGEKRRNCLFWSVSSIVAMSSKSHMMQRGQKASIWGKWLIYAKQN